MEKITALLPMKGHSERIPNKNLKDFAGRPLFHAVMETLLSVKQIEKVVINTDSEEIQDNALAHFKRVEIINRPEELRGDFVSMNNIIAYDLSLLAGEHFLQTHSTNPLLKAGSVENAIEFYFENLEKFDSLFSVTRWQTRFYWQDGSAVNHNPAELLRTQDLPPLFEENSNFYLFSKSSFQQAGHRRIGNRPGMFILDKQEAVDIDVPADFSLAEYLFKKHHERNP